MKVIEKVDVRKRPALVRRRRRGSRPEVRPVGPREARGPTDPAKIDRAVAFINQRARNIRGEMLAIGDYLLREFFDGDPKAVSRRSPEKMNSFRDLAKRDDLLLSYVTLWRAVQLAVQEKGVGIVSTWKQLNLSQKREFLVLDDVREKRALARRAAEEGWSARRTRDEVAKTTGKSGARHPRDQGGLPAVEKAIDRLTRAANQGPIAPERLDDIPRPDLERVTQKLQSAIGVLGRSLTVGLRLLAESGGVPAGPGRATA